MEGLQAVLLAAEHAPQPLDDGALMVRMVSRSEPHALRAFVGDAAFFLVTGGVGAPASSRWRCMHACKQASKSAYS